MPGENTAFLFGSPFPGPGCQQGALTKTPSFTSCSLGLALPTLIYWHSMWPHIPAMALLWLIGVCLWPSEITAAVPSPLWPLSSATALGHKSPTPIAFSEEAAMWSGVPKDRVGKRRR